MTEVAKELGKMWGEMSEDEKKPYQVGAGGRQLLHECVCVCVHARASIRYFCFVSFPDASCLMYHAPDGPCCCCCFCTICMQDQALADKERVAAEIAALDPAEVAAIKAAEKGARAAKKAGKVAADGAQAAAATAVAAKKQDAASAKAAEKAAQK